MEQYANYTLPVEPLTHTLLDQRASLTVTNTLCCGIITLHWIVGYLVFGTLRVSEQQHSLEQFMDHFIQKVLFTTFILEVDSWSERMEWAVWFCLLGSILILTKLCKERFEYLSLSPTGRKWPLIKISILMGVLLVSTIALNVIVSMNRMSTHTLFLLADSAYVLSFVVLVFTRFIVLIYDLRTNSIWETRSTIIYYTELLIGATMGLIELLHYVHILLLGYTSYTMKGWCLLRINSLLAGTRRRYRKHKNYLQILKLMESNFSLATEEDLNKNSDECAICWDSMFVARKLPCGHLFHTSCLRSWLEQDTSCPTCRSTLKETPNGQANEMADLSDGEEEFIVTARMHQRNPLFHFDSSRYTNNPLLRWLPTVSIEGFM